MGSKKKGGEGTVDSRLSDGKYYKRKNMMGTFEDSVMKIKERRWEKNEGITR